MRSLACLEDTMATSGFRGLEEIVQISGSLTDSPTFTDLSKLWQTYSVH
jgi:hypothetical protein